MTGTKPPEASREDFDLSKEVEGELERLARHPRSEARRLHDVAEKGESAVTPLIELVRVASRVIPFVILLIGLIFVVSYLASR